MATFIPAVTPCALHINSTSIELDDLLTNKRKEKYRKVDAYIMGFKKRT